MLVMSLLAEKDHSVLSVSIFYGWHEIVVYIVDTIGHNPTGKWQTTGMGVNQPHPQAPVIITC